MFARFSKDGRSLDLLDERGDVARTVRAGDGTGLVAALRPRADELVWLVTALDEQGLAAGVRALREDELRDAFAVAATGRTGGEAPAGVAMTLIPAYRSRPSALHTARAGVGAAFCCAFALVGALYRNPLVLAGRARRHLAGGDLRGGRAARSAARCGWRCRSRCWSRWSTRSSTRRGDRCCCAAASSSAAAGTSRSRRPSRA